jgi:L-lactate utilization protein LutB
MANNTGEKSFLKKVFQIIAGKPEVSEPQETEGLYAPQKDEPCDEKFARNFTSAGGYFLYCADPNEATDNFKKILLEVNSSGVLAHESVVLQFLTQAGALDLTQTDAAQKDVFMCTCEYVVAHDGSIVVTYNQLQGKRLEELPKVFIILAKTSQLVNKLSDAMTGIKEAHKGDIPTQITSVKPPLSKNAESTGPAKEAKNTFLLLIEDGAA